jgi:hypothetical protein
MNKMVKIIAFVAFAAIFGFSQEQENNSLFNARGALHFNTQALQTGSASDYSLSVGFVAGGIARLPIIKNVFFFSPGLDFMYRNACSECYLENSSSYDIKFKVYEFALSAPVLIQLEIFKLYLEGGAQFDLPLAQFYFYDASYGSLSDVKSEREKFDFGYVAGVGWKLDEAGMIGVRVFYSATGKYGDRNKPQKLIQLELAFTLLIP